MATRRAFPRRGLITAAAGLALTLACRTFSPAATPTPEIIADCFWGTEAFAWVDANSNGTPDEGEPPLAGVTVNFSLTFFSGAATGEDGLARVSGMHPGACDPALANSVVATAPDGYTPTTELVVAYTADRARYEFGFTPSP